jgi:hypothetical protein
MGEPGGSVGIDEQSALLNSRGSGKIHVEDPNTPLVAAVRQAFSDADGAQCPSSL